MSAIQNQKALRRKISQCDAKDVKSKTKTASHVTTAESKSRTSFSRRNLFWNTGPAKFTKCKQTAENLPARAHLFLALGGGALAHARPAAVLVQRRHPTHADIVVDCLVEVVALTAAHHRLGVVRLRAKNRATLFF